MGSKCLLVTRVVGRSRLPVPPARTTPFIFPPTSLDLDFGDVIGAILSCEYSGPCDRLDGFPLHLGDSQLWVGNQKMPNHRLKRLRMRRYGRRVDDRNEHTSVGNLGGVASVATHDSTDGGAHRAGILERPN